MHIITAVTVTTLVGSQENRYPTLTGQFSVIDVPGNGLISPRGEGLSGAAAASKKWGGGLPHPWIDGAIVFARCSRKLSQTLLHI